MANNENDIERFCDAVRAKDDWEIKILDGKRDLAAKWAQEAQLLSANSEHEVKEASERVNVAIQ